MTQKEQAINPDALLKMFIEKRKKEISEFFFKPLETYMIDKHSSEPIAVMKNNSIQNVAHIIEASRFKDTFKFDEFSQNVVVDDDTGLHGYASADYLALKLYCESQYSYMVNEKCIYDGVELYARMRNPFNSVHEYIEATEWDGKPRTLTMFRDLLGAEDNEYTTMVTRMFFGGLLKRIYEPGSKVDEMLVLIGKQGIGKSIIFDLLLGQNGWYKTYSTLPEEKRLGMEMAENVIIEFGEMSTFTPRNIEELKDYLTRTTDQFVPMYGHTVVKQPRHNVFVGTTNRSSFIYDFTGGRRFNPMDVGINEVDNQPMDMPPDYYQQVMAEAKVLYEQGNLSHLPLNKHEEDMLRKHQEGILMSDEQSDSLEKFFSMEQVPVDFYSLDAWKQRDYFQGYPQTMEDSAEYDLQTFDKVQIKTIYEVALEDRDYLKNKQAGLSTKINAIAERKGWKKSKSVRLNGKVSTGYKK